MPSRRVLTAVLFGAALVVLSGCGTTNPVSEHEQRARHDPAGRAAEPEGRASTRARSCSAGTRARTPTSQGYNVYRYAPDPSRENAYVKINAALVTDTQYAVTDASTSERLLPRQGGGPQREPSASSSAIEGAGVCRAPAARDSPGRTGPEARRSLEAQQAPTRAPKTRTGRARAPSPFRFPRRCRAQGSTHDARRASSPPQRGAREVEPRGRGAARARPRRPTPRQARRPAGAGTASARTRRPRTS